MTSTITNTKSYLVSALLFVFILTFSQDSPAPPLRFGPGLSINKGVPIVSPGIIVYTTPKGFAVAVDESGEFVHAWTVPENERITYARPLPGRELLARIIGNTGSGIGARMTVLNEFSFPIWSIPQPEGIKFHHDQSVIDSNGILILCSRELTVPHISDKTLIDDCLIKVDIFGNIVWEWRTADHFNQFDFSDEVKAGIYAAGGDWAHANSARLIPEDTSHTDPRFRPGNIIISYRFINQIVIVDQDTGDIVWRSDGLTKGQHDAHMLPDSVPGGGNLLVFDNGTGGKYGSESNSVFFSRVIEISPIDKSIPYQYTAQSSGQGFYWFWSAFISGAQRLPNGNTLICEGSYGRIFEVTPSGEIVWEYVNPIFTDIPGGNPGLENRVYRAHKVSYEDWDINSVAK